MEIKFFQSLDLSLAQSEVGRGHSEPTESLIALL